MGDSPLVMHLVFILATTRVAVNALGVASFFYGSGTRFRVGIALLFTQVSSLYAAYAYPFEYILDSRGRKTDEFKPFDPMQKRFLVGLLMATPLLLGLVLHLFEPGLLTSDKKSKAKAKK